MKLAALPPSISAAIPGIQWPLGTEAPPLHFKPLEELQALRKSDERPELVAFKNIPDSLEQLFPTEETEQEARHFGILSLALIFLGHGWTDECHNLITPLSWPDDIHFAHGPSMYSQASPAVQAYASYIHCLVHRKEAFHHGEFGMMGFQNANYWSGASSRSSGSHLLPHAEIHQQVRALANSDQFSKHPQVQKWCQDHVVDESFFESRAVHQLCATVLQQSPKDSVLQTFAEQVAEAEIRVLLLHSLQQAGYDVDPSVLRPSEKSRLHLKKEYD